MKTFLKAFDIIKQNIYSNTELLKLNETLEKLEII